MNKKKILVLGANGMLGKMVSLYLKDNEDLDVKVTSRTKNTFLDNFFKDSTLDFEITEEYKNTFNKLVTNNDFDFVINCIGVIKPKIDEDNNESILRTIMINSYFPLDLQKICFENSIKYYQIGTDCVYSGKIGNYDEFSYQDAEDVYGKSKVVGEIQGEQKHVIRSSIIGPETGKGFSLLNWFLNNKNETVSGFKNHLWNGVTTLNFARVLEGIIKNEELNFKVQHLIPSNTITKAKLLEEFKKCFNKNIDIEHIDAQTVVDRTLLTKNEELNKQLWLMAGYEKIPTVEENTLELANSKFTEMILD